MSGANNSEKNTEKSSEGEQTPKTSAKVSNESVTDEQQANRYEKHFTSFSSNNAKAKFDATDPLGQLMARVLGKDHGQQVGNAVAEFALEDKEGGKLITAQGDKNLHQPRQSWVDGLKRVLEDATTPEEILERQGQYSIDYMMRKLPDDVRLAMEPQVPGVTAEQVSQKLDEAGNIIFDGAVRVFAREMLQELGVLEGTYSFIGHTAEGIINVARMANAGARQIMPGGWLIPDYDPAATEMLNHTLQASSTMGRVLLQYNTTLNPWSPLHGVVFDPEAKDMATRLVESLPGAAQANIAVFKSLNPEQRSAIATEFWLNVATILLGTGELSVATRATQLKEGVTAIGAIQEGGEAAGIGRAGELIVGEGSAEGSASLVKTVEDSVNQTIARIEQGAKKLPNPARREMEQLAQTMREHMPKAYSKAGVEIWGETGIPLRCMSIDGQEIVLHRQVSRSGEQQWFYKGNSDAVDSVIKVHVTVNGPDDLAAVQRVLLPALENPESKLYELVGNYKTHDPLWGAGKKGYANPPAPTGNDAKGFTLYPREGASYSDIQEEADRLLSEAGLGLNRPIDTGNVDVITGASNRVGVVRESWPSATLSKDSYGASVPTEIQLNLESEFGTAGQKLTETQLKAVEQELGLEPNILCYASDGKTLAMRGTSKDSYAQNGNTVFYLDESNAGKGTRNGKLLSDRPAMYKLGERYGFDLTRRR